MTEDKKLTPEQDEINAVLVDTHIAMLATLGELNMDEQSIRQHINACEVMMRDNMEAPGGATKEQALGLSRDTFVCIVGRLHQMCRTLHQTCDQLQREYGGYVPGETVEPTDISPSGTPQL